MGLAVALAAWGGIAAAERAECDLPRSGAGVVIEIIDAQTLRLDDGTQLRLVNALAPSGGGSLAAAARTWLAQELQDRPVWFAHGGREADRHGRRLAHVFRADDGAWIQALLVDRGLSRVYSLSDNRACVGALLAREAKARRRQSGLWAKDYGAILPAEPPDRALERVGRYAIVEGDVLSVGERRLRTYLNFGTYWNVDFTVIISGRNRDRMAEAGMNLGDLAERRVRVRGWILEDRGPAIELTHPEQIEIVEHY